MEKIIVDNNGGLIAFDNDSDEIVMQTEMFDHMIRDAYEAKQDGKVITSTEVIDVKAGDIVLTAAFWSMRENKQISKVFVVSDPSLAYDMREFNQLRLEHKKQATNETI